MECNRIRISDFRNIVTADVSFCDGVNILLGANAQGKTNLLEAIRFAAIGKSFRTQHEEDLFRFGTDFCELNMDFSDSVRRQNITVRMMRGKRRQIEHNSVKVTKVSEMVGALQTVLFCPEHLSLIKDGPAMRRNYLDVALSQLYPVYLKTLQRYNQILKQRNALLRGAKENAKSFADTAEFWSRQLAHEAAVLSRYRYSYLVQAREHIRTFFEEMTGACEKPDAVYEGSANLDAEMYTDLSAVEARYLALLTENTDREIFAGSTLWGVHRDDIDIRINGRSARTFASQGQQRSLALAMKLAEGEVCASVCGEKPVFLFDDVFSELDPSRREYLSSQMRERQVIMTACEESGIVGGNVICVENGTYTQRIGSV